MVRNNSKVFAEVNDEDTVISSYDLTNNALIVGINSGAIGEPRKVSEFSAPGLYLVASNGTITYSPLPTTPSLLKFDAKFGLMWEAIA